VTRIFAVIWVTALVLATACTLALLSGDYETEVQYPQDFASALNLDIVFIGSSLTGNALPATELAHGVLGDGRSSAILSVDGISEWLTTRLLADAIDSGAETIFLEINAYAHNYANRAEPAFVSAITWAMREAGLRLTLKVKTLLNLSQNRSRVVRLGAGKGDRTIDPEKLRPLDYYDFQKIEPAFGDELKVQLARARKVNVEVIFFSPPRPQSIVSMIGNEEFADLHSHLNHIATIYDVPLWYSPIPWPDDHFMDILAHTNVRGRLRFQKELAEWYGTRQ